MHQTLVIQTSMEPSVAAYALIKTDCRSLDAAMDLIYERAFDRSRRPGRMQHPFVASVEVNCCFICANDKSLHAGK